MEVRDQMRSSGRTKPKSVGKCRLGRVQSTGTMFVCPHQSEFGQLDSSFIRLFRRMTLRFCKFACFRLQTAIAPPAGRGPRHIRQPVPHTGGATHRNLQQFVQNSVRSDPSETPDAPPQARNPAGGQQQPQWEIGNPVNHLVDAIDPRSCWRDRDMGKCRQSNPDQNQQRSASGEPAVIVDRGSQEIQWHWETNRRGTTARR